MGANKIDLKGVQETLLMPLWGRAVETQKEKPLLIDKEAVRIINSINYDFTQIAKKINTLTSASWIARSIFFDQRITDYLFNNPGGTVINIGCGFDTTYERVNNGKAMWYELDFPEVIASRKVFIQESDTRKFLSYSVFDPAWYADIEKKENVLVMMAGFIYFFDESDVRKLLYTFKREFKKSTVIFDYSSTSGIKIANKAVIKVGGLDQTAYLKWGTDNIYEIEKWHTGIQIDETMKMFAEYRKRFPLTQRLGMWISDKLSIMSLAKISIE